MRLGPLGIPEIIAIIAVILLIFGARRLPEIGSSVARASEPSRVPSWEKMTRPQTTSSRWPKAPRITDRTRRYTSIHKPTE